MGGCTHIAGSAVHGRQQRRRAPTRTHACMRDSLGAEQRSCGAWGWLLGACARVAFALVAVCERASCHASGLHGLPPQLQSQAVVTLAGVHGPRRRRRWLRRLSLQHPARCTRRAAKTGVAGIHARAAFTQQPTWRGAWCAEVGRRGHWHSVHDRSRRAVHRALPRVRACGI